MTVSIQHVLSGLHPCSPLCVGPFSLDTCPSEFLMPSVCIFRESLDHLVTKGGKDPSDHLATR